jgi:Ni/Co efflux regulator RcnB
MKLIMFSAIALTLVAASAASAQPDGHRNDQNARADASDHAKWGKEYGGQHNFKRGEQVGYNDWHGAQAVDYREHHLRNPPRGYEWRDSNGQYILAAVATGVIASIVMHH